MKKALMQISTHWDREWYLPFQGFRYYLVEMMDRLLETLEDGSLPEFVFDGQTIVLEDYLEIRPENRGRLEKLISSGKLKVGPWYVMPDELLVSGESLVENFLVGHNEAHKFGTESWKFGYVNDVFGHVAQFAQILAGFGIDGAYIGRGIDRDYPNNTHLLWKSPDGSECFVYKDCYATFKRLFRESDDRVKLISEKISASKYPVLFNYTDDHAVIDELTFDFLDKLAESGCEVVGGFEKLSELMKSYKSELPVIEGEQIATGRIPGDFRAVTNSISSYYPLKLRNDRIENLLYRQTAPLLSMAKMCGFLKDKEPFFDIARKYLLKNQPHDSICGCSVDAVHRDMPYRYSQAETIGEVIRESFKVGLSSKLDESETLHVLALNTDLHEKCGVVTLIIDFLRDWKPVFTDNTGYQQYNIFAITDADGKELPYQILKVERNFELYKRQVTTPVNRYTVAVDAKLLPFGVTELAVIPKSARSLPVPKSPKGSLRAENEFLSLTVSKDGEISVTDKQSGREYSELLSFVDDVDTGNGWFYGDANFDTPTVVSSGSNVRVEVIASGELVNTFRITKTIELPVKLERGEFRRSDDYVACEIVNELTLRRGAKHIEFKTTIDNRAGEHRLRLLIPTGIEGDDYSASQAFCFVNRSRGVSFAGHNAAETEFTEKNMSGILNVADTAAFIGAEGLHEGGVYPDGTISVTMLRSVGKMFHMPRAVEAQLIGKHEFKYAVAFSCEPCELLHIQSGMTNSPISHTVKGSASLGSLASLSDRRIQVSTVKPAEDRNGFIVRLYNPTDETVSCKLSVNSDVKITEVALSENSIGASEFVGEAELEFAPFKIKTLRVVCG